MTETPATPPLSETELAVMQLVATGATNREIARERGISEATVKKHLTNVNAKLGTGNRTEATRRALELGIVTVETPESGDGLERGAAKRLAEELERSRRRSIHLGRWLAATGIAAAVALLAVAYFALGPRDEVVEIDAPPPPSQVSPSWEAGVNLPTARTGISVVADDSDGSVYVIGGRDDSGLLSDTLRYSLDGYRWEPREGKPTAVRDAAAVEVRGEFVVPGGCDESGRALDVVEIYDPARDAWRAGERLPEPRCGFALAELGGEVYLFGGRASDDPATASDQVWRYEPKSDTWAADSDLPLPRSDLAAVVEGRSIRLLGGRDETGEPQTNHWVFSPFRESAKWEMDEAPLPEGRAGLSAAATSVRNIHVVGGGWDRTLDDGTLVLRLTEPSAEWEADVPLQGFTPHKGAGMVVADGRVLVLAGGEVDDALLDRHYRREVIRQLIFP